MPLPTPTAQVSPQTQKIKIFLIAKEDEGKSGKLIGYDDSAIPVEREIPHTWAVLRAVVEKIYKGE